MKNPYAKPSKKRPRPHSETGATPTETVAVSHSSSNDRNSFGASEVDWNIAVQMLDQASQSYEQRSKGSPDKLLQTQQQESKPPASIGQQAKNPYRQTNNTRNATNSRTESHDRKPQAVSGSSAPHNNVKPQAISAASSSCMTKSVTATSVSSDVSRRQTPAAMPSVASVPVKSTAAVAATVQTKAPVAKPVPRSVPLPSTWVQKTAVPFNPATSKTGGQTFAGARTGSMQAKMVSQSTSTMQSTNALTVSSRPVPLPSSWASKSITANPGNTSRLSSAQPASGGMPPVLNYAPESVRPVNDEYRATLVKNASLSEKLLNGWELYKHQRTAVIRALVMRRFILALDMGMGKTIIGCVWAKAFAKTFENLRIIVVCPVSLKQEWKRTAEEATGLQVDDNVMQICSWAKVPAPPDDFNYVAIFDEAHSIQSLESARTKNALKLVKPSRCVGVLMLTGTPMKNGKPANLFPLLRAVQHPFGKHQKAYETYFCAGKEKSFGRGRVVWDANGSSNLVELRKHVASHMLHMTKEQCLSSELPPKKRVFRQVPISSRHQLQHNQALSELAKVYATNNGSFGENNSDVILTAVQRVRQIGSFAKIDATVALAKEVLQEQPAVVIFSSFATVAKALHKQLAECGFEGKLLIGETNSKKRQGLVDDFQNGLSPVFVSTFGAGGVGLTLTAAHTIILLDRPWTPGEAQQAEDRVRRIGQTKPVTSIWMVAFELDKQIDSLLEQKSNTSSMVLNRDGGTNAAAYSGDAPKISVFALLKSVLANRHNDASATSTGQTNSTNNMGTSD